jgi:hypothetical protein
MGTVSDEEFYAVFGAPEPAEDEPEAPAPSPPSAEVNGNGSRAVVPPSGIVSVPASEIKPRSIRWFEKPLWQSSAFTLLAAPKGAGKGTYLAGLAARVSRSGNVLFVATEDSAEVDLVPRLMAAGANLERCRIVRQHIKLPDDVEALRLHALELGGVDMLVVDPIANHIGDRNSNSESEVRDAIGGLNGLANELECMLIGVRHPGKDRSRGAVASILGSTAWADLPRAVVMIVVDDVDPLVRHIQVVAGNRSLNGAAQSFRIDAVPVAGLEEPITLAVDLGASEKNVEQLLAAPSVGGEGGRTSKSSEARELILDILDSEGEQESDALDARVAGQADVAAKTVRNIRTALANHGLIRSKKVGETWHVLRTNAPR